jgi:uncharacterized membrane protein
MSEPSEMSDGPIGEAAPGMAIGGVLGRGRLEAFSDGVMAIAITLLILDVKVPDVDEGQSLSEALAHQWPSYAAYVLTFFVIGIMWVNHHYLFERVRVVTRSLLFLNILLLMAVAALPFPTALLATYLKQGDNSHIAAAVYGINMTIISLSFTMLWLHLARHDELMVEGANAQDAMAALRGGLVGGVVYAATVVLAFISAQACLVVWALLAVYFMVWRGRSGPASRSMDSR